jgi:hypothetical protein
LLGELRALNRESLADRLNGLLTDEQISGILARRDALLLHLDGLIADRGEAEVLF